MIEAFQSLERPTFELSEVPAWEESALHLPDVAMAALDAGQLGGAVVLAEQDRAVPES